MGAALKPCHSVIAPPATTRDLLLQSGSKCRECGMLRRNQGQAPYGFRWQGGCLLQVAEEVLIVQEIFRGMADTGAVSAVVKKLRAAGHLSRRRGAWSDVQVGRVLRCSAAIGKYEVGKGGGRRSEVVECDPIVS